MPGAESVHDSLKRQILELCLLISKGKRAKHHWKIRVYNAFRFMTVILTSVGGIGVAAQHVSSKDPPSTWLVGTIVLGIIAQLVKEFGLEGIAGHASEVASKCSAIDTVLQGDLILNDDPQEFVRTTIKQVVDLLQDSKYNSVLPPDYHPPREGEGDSRPSKAPPKYYRLGEERAKYLIAQNEGHWKLRAQRQGRRPTPGV